MKSFRLLACAAMSIALSTATAVAQDELAKLSDEFDDPKSAALWQRVDQVEQWNANQLELFDVNSIYKGHCALMPYTSTWYRDYRGALLFKPVKGDFIMTAKVKVTGRDGKSAPNSSFSLAGLMVRTPRDVTPETWQPGGENYVFLSLGAADRNGVYQFEHKTTVNSNSQLKTVDANSPEALLQIARLGAAVVVVAKTPTSPWVVLARYHRPDLPGEVQCGMTVYTDYNSASQLQPRQHNATVIKTGKPDLGALYDFVRYQTPRVPAELQGRNFADTNAVSDAQLLSFLGDGTSEAAKPAPPGFATGAARP